MTQRDVSNRPILRTPPEIIGQVLHLLPLNDLYQAACVSVFWRVVECYKELRQDLFVDAKCQNGQLWAFDGRDTILTREKHDGKDPINEYRWKPVLAYNELLLEQDGPETPPFDGATYDAHRRGTDLRLRPSVRHIRHDANRLLVLRDRTVFHIPSLLDMFFTQPPATKCTVAFRSAVSQSMVVTVAEISIRNQRGIRYVDLLEAVQEVGIPEVAGHFTVSFDGAVCPSLQQKEEITIGTPWRAVNRLLAPRNFQPDTRTIAQVKNTLADCHWRWQIAKAQRTRERLRLRQSAALWTRYQEDQRLRSIRWVESRSLSCWLR
jgi:hypothetical protein